jgi:hypothetical protein
LQHVELYPEFHLVQSGLHLLIGDAALLKTTLGAAASVFLGPYTARLGYRAAEATADKLAELFKSRDVLLLAETAKALSEAKQSLGTSVTIQIGVDVPSDRTPTILEIAENDRVKIAFAVSNFVARVDEITKTITSEAAQGRASAVQATVALQEDGSFRLTWQYWNSSYDKIEKGEIRLPGP